MRIKKGDTVKIIAGKDKGKKGKVLQVFVPEGKLVVEGHNLLIKHARPKREREKGQRVKFSAPLAISNVMLVCPKCSRPTRVGAQKEGNNKKVRKCSKCHGII